MPAHRNLKIRAKALLYSTDNGGVFDGRGPEGEGRLTEEEAAAVLCAFLLNHPGCGERLEIHHEGGFLICYCGCCNVLKTLRLRWS